MRVALGYALVSVCALLLNTRVCHAIRWLALARTDPAMAFNQTQNCKHLEGLVSAQQQLCRSNLDLMQSIIQAAREVKKTCQKTFSDMRWNCSSIELAPYFPPDLERGTRESAFVYALSAAAISHTIARACTTGDLPGCSCGPLASEAPGPGFRWGGCNDNLNYGIVLGSKFSDSPMKMKKSRSQANKLMNLHNSEVGRQPLVICNLCSSFPFPPGPLLPSPFCRQCNKTSNGSDSCTLMCCGRGYNPYMEKVVERCHCKYHWCCYVTCKRCERIVERYVCK
ncbi:protein Wnt-11-like [Rhincodon typus]|uniref:protein Wnt-11-like n=1 Tax=Rhincodon typus TaxID=259920 RepID=UPI00202F758D|nr:protein Wnt-11-like [Rhincodon typus]